MNPPTTLTNHNPPATIGCGLNPNPIRREESDTPHIDDVERLRAGASQAVLPFRVVAPSTAGSFLRSFTFGHVRQLDKAAELGLRRAWSVGAAPDAAEMTVDLDSTGV